MHCTSAWQTVEHMRLQAGSCPPSQVQPSHYCMSLPIKVDNAALEVLCATMTQEGAEAKLEKNLPFLCAPMTHGSPAEAVRAMVEQRVDMSRGRPLLAIMVEDLQRSGPEQPALPSIWQRLIANVVQFALNDFKRLQREGTRTKVTIGRKELCLVAAATFQVRANIPLNGSCC